MIVYKNMIKFVCFLEVFREEYPVTEKELKKLNRYQLLELLIAQTERADMLQAKLENMEKQLKAKELTMSSMGSIAEAALELNDVFKAAQAAADLYVYIAKNRAAEIEENAKKKAAEIISPAEMHSHNTL